MPKEFLCDLDIYPQTSKVGSEAVAEGMPSDYLARKPRTKEGRPDDLF